MNPQSPEAPNAIKDQLGRELRDLRISVIDACNLRCTYCMPETEGGKLYQFLKQRELLSADEIVRLVNIAVSFGVKKIRLTGGEPLMRKDLAEIVRRIAELPQIEDIALTTNGYWLAEQAEALRAAGLHRVTVSLDTLNPDRAEDLSGRAIDPARILAGIQAADRAGFRGLKVNSVIMRDRNDDEILTMAEAFRGTHQVLRFIEYMDVGSRNNWQSGQVVSGQEIVDRIQARYPLEAVPPRWAGEVAKRYRYVDGQGEIGVITAISQPFCRSCNRARISADGRLFTCLFASDGVSLRDMMRAGASDNALAQTLAGIWLERNDRYSEIRYAARASSSRAPIEMNQIGG